MVHNFVVMTAFMGVGELPRVEANKELFERLVAYSATSIQGSRYDLAFQPKTVVVLRDQVVPSLYRVESPNIRLSANVVDGRVRGFSNSYEFQFIESGSEEALVARAKGGAELLTGKPVVFRSIRRGTTESRCFFYVTDRGVRFEPIVEVNIMEGTGFIRSITSYRTPLPLSPPSLRPTLEVANASSAAVLAVFSHHNVHELEPRSTPELFISELKGMAPSIEAFRSEATPTELESAHSGQGFLVYKTAFARPGSEFVEFLVSVDARDGRAMLITDLRNPQGRSGAKVDDTKPEPVAPATVFTKIATKKKSITLAEPLKEHKGKVTIKRDFDAVFWSGKTAVVGRVDKKGFVSLNGKTYLIPAKALKTLTSK
ncbi:MAG TPA: hypothetical protein PKA27_10860 [Fimbriimonadaceae bacterium]|nr:hypothetical protein [Fimbriimonadaceae bacterium]